MKDLSDFFKSLLHKKKQEKVDSTQSKLPMSQEKSYVLMRAQEYFQPLDVAGIFNGDNDSYFLSDEDNEDPSGIFELRCKQSDSLIKAKSMSSFMTGAGKQTIYIMAMGYTEEEVKQLAARGEFSKAIIRAYNARDLAEIIQNPKFVSDLCLRKSAIESPRSSL